MERNNRSIIWGIVLILLGLVFLSETLGVVRFLGRVVWSVVFVAGGVAFLLVYGRSRSQWWALIPGCTLAGIGLGILVGGAMTPILIVGSISLPFWIIYLQDRQQWWALIPGWVLASVVMIILLDEIGLSWFVAPFVMFAIAAPFLLVYLRDSEQWWALIPGGIMGMIGILLMVDQVASAGVFWAILLILLGLFFVYRAMRGGPAPSGGGRPEVEESAPPEALQLPEVYKGPFEAPEPPEEPR